MQGHIRLSVHVARDHSFIIVSKDQATLNFIRKRRSLKNGGMCMSPLNLKDGRVKMGLLGFSVAYDVELFASQLQLVEAS